MHRPELRVDVPENVADFFDGGALRSAVDGIADLAGAVLAMECARTDGPPTTPGAASDVPIRRQGLPVGRIACKDAEDNPRLLEAARHVAAVVEHTLEREATVVDLAQALVGAYSELNLLYHVLPAIATRTDVQQIAQLLVDEAARALACRRVSLLMYDNAQSRFTLVASRGLPEELKNVEIPVAGSIAGRAAQHDGLLIVQDILDSPDLAACSRGRYDTRAFAVVRVPLRAQGQALGVLAVTERENGGEFDSHDIKLLEALSAAGASALMSCRLHATMTRQMLGTIEALASAVDAKDQCTHSHSRRVAELCLAGARVLPIQGELTCRELELSGLLHDIGKIGIPDSILSKCGPLTSAEFEVMKTHVTIGARIIGRAEGLERVARTILHHHERWDGLGYPAGLAREEIPIGSRLIAIADTYDCLISDRPYHKAIPPADALREISRCRGAQFDPTLVDVLEKLVTAESA